MAERGAVTAALIFLLLAGCGGDPGTGPREVKWDRDACERCRMVLSDRHHAAQVRYRPAGAARSRVAPFDDIGCATLWLEEQPWKENGGVEIWVVDHRDGRWIDARGAAYLANRVTPMGYGLVAQSDPVEGGLTFEQAIERVNEVERRFNAHSDHLLQSLGRGAPGRKPASGPRPGPTGG